MKCHGADHSRFVLPQKIADENIRMLRFDAERLRILVERHLLFTNSARARELLEDWDNALSHFIKVMPRDYKRALLDLKAEATSKATVAAE